MTVICVLSVAACFVAIAILKKKGKFLWQILPYEEIWDIPVKASIED